MFIKTLLLLTAVTATYAAPHEHSGHDHGGDAAWEWSGIFTMPDVANMVLSVGKNGKYADRTMDVLTLKTTKAEQAGIEAVEDTAKHLFENASTFVPVDAHMTKIVIPNKVHRLTMDDKSSISIYQLGAFEKNDANNDPIYYVLFMQHFPSEFEHAAGHFLKSKSGQEIIPTMTEPAAVVAAEVTHTSEHAGQAIGASIIVTLLGALGLFVVYPCWNALGQNASCILWANSIAQCFAAGALLSTSFFLIFPEALHHLAKAHPKSDVQQTIVFGSTTLTGVVLSMIISMLCSLLGAPSASLVDKKEIELNDIETTDKDTEKESNNKNNNVAIDLTALPKKPFCQCRPSEWTGAAWTVLVGDFFHNVADGIAIGVAFRTCDPAFGWVVALGAIAHEVSQEVADFCLLITRGNMSVGSAVLANLLSGVSCIIGAVVASYVEMSEEAVGGLLAFSGGVYLWAAMCECLAPLVEDTTTSKAVVLRVLMFSVGAICIGLVLINHVHCEVGLPPAAPGEDPHAGHNH